MAGRPPARPPPDPDYVQRGARLFLDPRLSASGERSCASCHPGGGTDGVVRRGVEPVPPATSGGRDTPALFGCADTAPYLWDGSAATLEDAVALMLRRELGGASLDDADFRALVSYVASIRPFERGRLAADGRPLEPTTFGAQRGFEIFERAGCAECHPPPSFSTPRPRDVGTGGPIDVPTLRGLGSTGPWGHDGRWSDVEAAVVAMPGGGAEALPAVELESLLAYLALL